MSLKRLSQHEHAAKFFRINSSYRRMSVNGDIARPWSHAVPQQTKLKTAILIFDTVLNFLITARIVISVWHELLATMLLPRHAASALTVEDVV